MVEWSNLGSDLLISISEKIEFYEDFKSFGGVFKSWRKAIQHAVVPSGSRQAPWLMVTERDHDNNMKLRFYDLNKGVVFETKLPVFQPRPANNSIDSIRLNSLSGYVYTSRGWLICINTLEMGLYIFLLHPLSKMLIRPPIFDFKLIRLDVFGIGYLKFCLCEDPLSTSDYILVMNIPYTADLAFWRSGDKDWSFLNHSLRGLTQLEVKDFTFHKGDLYTVDICGRIMAKKMSTPFKVSKLVIKLDLDYSLSQPVPKWYLVESSTVLFRIKQEFCWDPSEKCKRTRSFIVWEVNVKSSKIKRVNNLRNKVVFIGKNSSFCIEAVPIANFKPNCIYYIDSTCYFWWGDHGCGVDMSVFDLATGQIIKDLSAGGISCHVAKSTMWVESSLMRSSSYGSRVITNNVRSNWLQQVANWCKMWLK